MFVDSYISIPNNKGRKVSVVGYFRGWFVRPYVRSYVLICIDR
jgi:hypothetical protein